MLLLETAAQTVTFGEGSSFPSHKIHKWGFSVLQNWEFYLFMKPFRFGDIGFWMETCIDGFSMYFECWIALFQNLLQFSGKNYLDIFRSNFQIAWSQHSPCNHQPWWFFFHAACLLKFIQKLVNSFQIRNFCNFKSGLKTALCCFRTWPVILEFQKSIFYGKYDLFHPHLSVR